jgi:hypothetical protein
MIRFLQLGLAALFTVVFCFSLMENTSPTIESFIMCSMIGLVTIPLFNPSTFENRHIYERLLIPGTLILSSTLAINTHLLGGVAGVACMYLVGAEIAYVRIFEQKRKALRHACTVFQNMNDAQRALIVLHMRKQAQETVPHTQSMLDDNLNALLVSDDIIGLLQTFHINQFCFIAKGLLEAIEKNSAITFTEKQNHGEKRFVTHLPKTEDIKILGV